MKLWISTDGNGGYDIGQGDVTIASVLASGDVPRPMIPFAQEHDPRALALLFKAAPDLLAALEAIEAQLADHPDANKGNAKVHFCLMQARGAIAKAKGE